MFVCGTRFVEALSVVTLLLVTGRASDGDAKLFIREAAATWLNVPQCEWQSGKQTLTPPPKISQSDKWDMGTLCSIHFSPKPEIGETIKKTTLVVKSIVFHKISNVAEWMENKWLSPTDSNQHWQLDITCYKPRWCAKDLDKVRSRSKSKTERNDVLHSDYVFSRKERVLNNSIHVSMEKTSYALVLTYLGEIRGHCECPGETELMWSDAMATAHLTCLSHTLS